MKNTVSAIVFHSLIVSVPFIIALFAFFWLQKKKKLKRGLSFGWTTFIISYISTQGLITVLSIQTGIRSSGMEDVPVWGVVGLINWSAAILITPIISLAITLLLHAFRNKKNGA